MSRGHWIAIFATFGIAALCAGVVYGLNQQVFYEQEAQRRGADYAKRAADKVKQSCFGESASEKRKCAEIEASEYKLEIRNSQREQNDLAAQQISAVWTSIMGIAALIGMALSAIGVALVWTTFKETKQTNLIAMKGNARNTRRAVEDGRETGAALEIANKNAAAAIELAQATKDSVENTKALVAATAANSRPWIKIDVRPSGPLIFRDGGLRGTFAISVECLGKMPALKVMTWIEMGCQQESGPFVAGLCIDRLRSTLRTAGVNNLPMGNLAFPGESYTHDPFDAATAHIDIRQGEIYPVIPVGAVYEWAGGSSETLMSYWLMDRGSERMANPVSDWEISVNQVQIRSDSVHSIT
jgi:hypothetical protein